MANAVVLDYPGVTPALRLCSSRRMQHLKTLALVMCNLPNYGRVLLLFLLVVLQPKGYKSNTMHMLPRLQLRQRVRAEMKNQIEQLIMAGHGHGTKRHGMEWNGWEGKGRQSQSQAQPQEWTSAMAICWHQFFFMIVFVVCVWGCVCVRVASI